MAYTDWDAQDNVEPISDSNIEGIANMSKYAVISGCTASYSISDMVVTIAAGVVLHNGTLTTVAGNTVTLVSDPSNPRWTWIGIDSSGTAVLVSGSAAATPTVPELGDNVGIALDLVQASQTIAGNITYKLPKRVVLPTGIPNGWLTKKYKTGAQTVSASTSFADVTASSGNFAFTIAASEVWMVRYVLPLSFTSTGGAKWQLTGPSAPTSVVILPQAPTYISATDPQNGWRGESAATAFSSTFSSYAAGATSGSLYNTSVAGGLMVIEATIANGANAGTVTLQVAQNTAAGTAVIGAGATMRAERIA